MAFQQRDSNTSRSTVHPPELPRVYLDTRMPPAPPPGARVIVVGPPAPKPRRSDVMIGALTIGAAVVIALAFRWARHRRPG
jgi:hypothetical protein